MFGKSHLQNCSDRLCASKRKPLPCSVVHAAVRKKREPSPDIVKKKERKGKKKERREREREREKRE